MSDKDMTERNVLSEQFPQSKHLVAYPTDYVKRGIHRKAWYITGRRKYVLGGSVENGICKK